MNFNKPIIPISHLNDSKSKTPLIQPRILSRATSIKQKIYQQTKQNYSKENLHKFQKSSFQNIKQDQSTQIEQNQLKLRSRSLTHRQKQSQINHQIINQQHIINITNNLEISLTQQGMQFQIMNQKRKNLNKVLNFILKQKNNNSKTLNFGSNMNIANSQNDSQNEISERYKINSYQKFKQFDFESQIPEGPLLSFRQFAKMQGLKIPQFLE